MAFLCQCCVVLVNTWLLCFHLHQVTPTSSKFLVNQYHSSSFYVNVKGFSPSRDDSVILSVGLGKGGALNVSAPIAICKSHWSLWPWFLSTRFTETRSKDLLLPERVTVFFSLAHKRGKHDSSGSQSWPHVRITWGTLTKCWCPSCTTGCHDLCDLGWGQSSAFVKAPQVVLILRGLKTNGS